MDAELITWDANCEDVLCDSVLGHYVCGNLHRCHANAQVWEEITDNVNACMGKAFTVRRVIRRWKRNQQNYCRAMVGRNRSLRPNVSPVASPDRLSDDLNLPHLIQKLEPMSTDQ
nr:hypothetical protein CFP56_15135 [Quercus suber]